MAIYHFTAKVVSRKAGQSTVATAAYNARDKLVDERTGEVKDYSRKEGLIFSGIFTPKDAPEWAHDREQLWNQAEAAEKRKDSTIARNYEAALPHELSDEQRRWLVQDFVKENFTRKGYAADVNIHAPDKEGDDRNYHVHILVTDRRLQADGFAKTKEERQLKSADRKAELEGLRESWERIGNRHLERHGFEPTLDRRTLEEQGIDREPTKHIGVHAEAMERKGVETERGDEARQIEARNAERARLKQEAEKTGHEIEAEEKQRARAAHLGATLYDRGGMVSQQTDAVRDHHERQKILDEKELNQRSEWLKENLPIFQKTTQANVAQEQQNEAKRERAEQSGEQRRADDHEAQQKREAHDEQNRQQKDADYRAIYGKTSPSQAGDKELTDAQRARLERAAKYLESMNREMSDRSRENEQGEVTDRSRERTRER